MKASQKMSQPHAHCWVESETDASQRWISLQSTIQSLGLVGLKWGGSGKNGIGISTSWVNELVSGSWGTKVNEYTAWSTQNRGTD